MSSFDLYRGVRNGWGWTEPHQSLGVTRNILSQFVGEGRGTFAGVNRAEFKLNGTVCVYTVQKLTPVLKPLENGSLQLDLEWVDLP